MGTFERAYTVDGCEYELYRQHDRPTSYQLVDRVGDVIARGLRDVPEEGAVVALVRERIGDVE